MSLLSLDDALARLLAAATPVTETETVDTLAASGRVLAAGQVSTIDVPGFDNSSMDGYALRVADVPRPGTVLPVSQRIPAGSVGWTLAPGTAARIFTGAPLPAGADAVVMQELCARDGDSVVINHQPRSGEWLRRMGEDIRRGAEILAAGTRLRPQEVGLAASVGLASLPVRRRLKVALMCTGDELVAPGQPLPPGKLYNSNRYLMASLLAGLGCSVTDLGIVPDTLADTRAFLRRGAGGHDLILSTGGMSVGEEDHFRPAVEAEGELGLWRIAMKPGKPLAFGRIGGGAGVVPVIGLPGNPVAAFVTFLLLVRPFVLRIQGVEEVAPRALPLRADFDWPRADARREFLRVRLNAEGGVELYANQGSGVLSSATWGDGLVDNPPGKAIQRGDSVRFLPFSELLN